MIFILLERHTGKQTDTKISHLLIQSSICLQSPGLGQVKARNQRLGLPHGCQDPGTLAITPAAQGAHEQKDGSEAEFHGIELSTLIWNARISSDDRVSAPTACP